MPDCDQEHQGVQVLLNSRGSLDAFPQAASPSNDAKFESTAVAAYSARRACSLASTPGSVPAMLFCSHGSASTSNKCGEDLNNQSYVAMGYTFFIPDSRRDLHPTPEVAGCTPHLKSRCWHHFDQGERCHNLFWAVRCRIVWCCWRGWAGHRVIERTVAW
jgi:hypothetical protein